MTPLVVPGSSKPTAFTPKTVTGKARASDVMAALERVNDDLIADRKALRDPITALVYPPSASIKAGLGIAGPSFEAKKLSGEPIMLFFPMLSVIDEGIDPMLVARAMPSIQAYGYKVMVRQFRPIGIEELQQQPKP